jgi:putative ABC transport system ATP-binding protein
MIEVRNLMKKFGQKTVYEAISYQFEFGKSYAIIGESGSGKSTFLNAVARLEQPTSGLIQLNGQDIWKLKESAYFEKHLGYIFQNYALIDDETVAKNLALVDKNEIRQIEVLAQVGLDERYLKSKIYELSGGQAQRIAIARLLLKKSDIILADEPTGALDEKTAEEVETLLLSLVNSESVLIVATHDRRLAKKMDHIIDMARYTNEKEG